MSNSPSAPVSPPETAPRRIARWRPPLLHNRNFLLLWGGDAVSAIGDQLYELALMWYVLQATGSALKTGAVPAFGFIAQLTLGLVAGALADRWPRKRIMMSADLTRGLLVAVAGALALTHRLPLWYVYFSSFALVAVGLFFTPAAGAAMPEIVGHEHLVQANALLTTTRRLTAIIGKGIGGGAVAIVGPAWAMVANAASFVVSATGIGLARFPRLKQEAANGSLNLTAIRDDIGEGLRFVREHPVLKPLTVIAILANFGGGLTTGLVPFLVERRLGAGAEVLGILLSALAIGQLLGTSVMGVWGKSIGLGSSLIFSLIVGGLVYVFIAAISWWPAVAILFGLEGFALAVGNIPIGTLLQLGAPAAIRGRVITAFAVAVNLGSPPAVALGALAADRLGIPFIYVIAGLLVVLSGVWGWSKPALRAA